MKRLPGPVRRLLARSRWDRERVEEIEFYLQIQTEENIARGMGREEAEAAARRKLGNRTLIREEIYRMNSIAFLDVITHDARHVLRTLRMNPLFAIITLLTLAIGIGTNTAVFSVLNSMLLRPLAYPRAEELVAVWNKAPGAGGLTSVNGDLPLSASMFVTFSEQNRVFQAMGVWAPDAANVTGIGEPEEVRVVWVSEGVLEAFAVPPAIGRWLTPADQKPDAPDVTMLSYGYWQRRFGGDRSVIGRTLTVNSQPREIVGVMPQRFRVVTRDADLIMPPGIDRSKLILPGFGWRSVARLKPGVTIEQADGDIARLVPVWINSWPAAPGINPHVYDKWRITPSIRPLKDDVVGNVGRVLWVLMATIGLVMLIACANVANLLLVRAEARQQELSIRAALGAGWARIVRALLVESVMLGLLGGVLGAGLAYAGLRLLVATAPGNLPRLDEISLDARALVFTFGLSILAGLLFGLIPALKYEGPGISLAMRSSGRSLSQSRERHRARNVLVIAQVAMALVLLVSAGLMIRTFQALRTVEPGFEHPEHVQIVRISIPSSLVTKPEMVLRTQNEIADKIRAIPGVTSVAFAGSLPMDGIVANWDAIQAEDHPATGTDVPPMRVFKSVSPGVFQTDQTRLIAGRDFTWDDLYGMRRVAIVSEKLARELWGSAPVAIGKRINTIVPRAPWREVVGVVEDVRDNGVDEPAPAIVYWPVYRESIYLPGRIELARVVSFAIRSERAGTRGLLNQVSQAVWSVNASLPLAGVETLRDLYDKSLARASFALMMLAIASAMALVLGIVGIYGVMSYVVSQRRREIGIRLALGAQPRALRRMFVRDGLVLAVTGVALGIGAAAGLMPLMKSLLFEISPLDPATYAAVPVVLMIAAMLASYVPARRAAAVDPVETLRAE